MPRNCARRLALLAVATLAPVAVGQEGPAKLERVGAFYRVHFDGHQEALADAALEVVEGVWPQVAAAFGAPKARPGKPLDVHLYRELSGYAAAERELTGGRFGRNLAMAHRPTISAHVAVQPPCTDETLRAIGLPPQTIMLLAWEATHLARYELCPNSNDHPMWLVDGLAASVSRRVTAQRLGCDALEMGSWSEDLRRTQALARDRKLPSAEALLADRVDELDLGDRYALRGEWFGFLWSGPRRASLEEFLRTVRSTGAGASFAAKVLERANNSFGKLDTQFEKYVAAQSPRWEEVFRSIAPHEQAWLQIAFPEKNAIAWSPHTVDAAAFRARGRLRILPGGRGQMNLLFGRDARGFYSVAFVADQGLVVFDYDAASDSWTRLLTLAAPALRPGVAAAFEVSVEKGVLRVALEGERADVKLPRALTEPVAWGLGAQSGGEGATTGSAGMWIGLSVGR